MKFLYECGFYDKVLCNKLFNSTKQSYYLLTIKNDKKCNTILITSEDYETRISSKIRFDFTETCNFSDVRDDKHTFMKAIPASMVIL